ncbi:putative zinc finger (CCCH type) protein [Neospora caninum Liverpool]|nr:putative zinc finger (CCCH type) protein [Neospora caninum Liverpool]CBZ55999.1 putative zinc finger (CCCH type) protein [Neospora caninum Liverpool]|eukprot:XP_003886025.1 putative zinc finger (CCCH type) protein [Neospora caninum Liverpool]
MFKTNMCLKWNRGKCKAGAECNHAHGEEELRFYRFLAYSNGTRDFRSEAEVGALRSGRAADEKEGSPSHSSAQGKDAYAGVAQKGAQHASESVAGNQQCRQTCGANVRHASGAARGSWSGSKGVAAVSGRFSGSASPTTTGCMSKSQSVASLSLFKKEGEDWRREDEGTGVSVSGESSGSVLDEAEQQRRHLYEELLAREQEQRRREQASQEEYLRLLLTLAAYAPDLFRSLFLSPNSPGLESEMILNPSQRCPLNVQAKRPSHSADASFAVGDAGEGEEKGAKGEDAASSWRNFLAVLKPDAPFQATPEQSVDNSVLTAALAAAVQSKQKPKEASRPEERPARAEVESLMGPSLFSGAVPQSVDDSLTPRLEVPLHFPLGGRVSTPACRCAGSGTPDSFSTCAGGEDCVERLTNCLQFAASDDKEQGTGTSLPPSPLLFGSQSPAISYESVENASFMSTPPLQGGGLPFSAASWEQRRRGTQVDGAVGPNALFDTVALRAREENLCRGDGVAAQKEGPFGPVQSLFADQESMTFYSDPWRANEERTARDASSLLQAFKPGDTELRDNHWNGQAVELIFAQKTAARAAQRREDKGVEHGQPPASGATLQDALALLQSLGLIADSPKQRCSAGAAETHARG